MRSGSKILAAALTILWLPGAAGAAAIKGTVSEARGIANLTYSYNGEDYRFDVDFVGNTSYNTVYSGGPVPYFEGDAAGAQAAMSAMIDVLNAEGVAGIYGLTIPLPGTPEYDFYNQTGLFLAMPTVAPYDTDSGTSINWTGPTLTTTGGENPVLTGWTSAYGSNWSTSTPYNFLAWVELRSVPEPGTLALFALGLAGLGVARRRRAA